MARIFERVFPVAMLVTTETNGMVSPLQPARKFMVGNLSKWSQFILLR